LQHESALATSRRKRVARGRRRGYIAREGSSFDFVSSSLARCPARSAEGNDERSGKGPQMTDLSPAYHYQVIARALAEIDTAIAAGGPALTLDTLAARMRMSPAHFQRVFSQWVGVSPKRYQQYLTIGHARRLLADRHTTLAAAHEAGLSGAGRLHDLFLTWEAMSPGDYARGGAGLTMRWGWFESPFGPALVMATDRGISGMGFADETGVDAAFQDLIRRWPQAAYVEDPVALRPLVDAAFGGKATSLHLIGAPFQIKVWEALMSIPTGHVTTYGDIAAAIGHPSAQRAVGTAVGRNPISFLIPCHRALRRDGGLGGYHWGLARKRAMLAWEAARAEA
jgi:AraC family transcriptional regulator of adaptative response/methylated-DNA-[protein]-cysteine methyltransferase